MNATYYLVDNNALLSLGRQRRSSEFFEEHCRITVDVAYEARFLSDSPSLNDIEMTPRVLEHLRDVMESIRPGETDLIDLYKNKGMADPVMVATIRALTEVEEALLFPDTWVLVTHDKALTRLAQLHDLVVITPEAVATFIDRSQG